MSVYTVVTEKHLKDLLEKYEIGALQDCTGIAGGITNTNYCLSTDQGKFALTLFEQHSQEELPFYFNILIHLSSKHFPCAEPVFDKHGGIIQVVADKPAVLFHWCKGDIVSTIEDTHIKAIGAVLGQMHAAMTNFSTELANPRNLVWIKTTAEKLKTKLSDEQQQLLQQELEFQQQQQAQYMLLPKGVIHADLFHDNVLFVEDKVSAVLDFYYACHDYLLLDVATTLLDWCADTAKHLQTTKAQLLLNAYQQHRILTAQEKQQLLPILRLAALRYWMSRLNDFHFPNNGAQVLIKDPQEYEAKLRQLTTFEL